MADRIGVESCAGFRLPATTGDTSYPPTAIAIAKLLPLISSPITFTPVRGPRSRQVQLGQSQGPLTVNSATTTIQLQASYNEIEHLWAILMGRQAYSISGTTLPEEVVAGAYRHTFELSTMYRAHPWQFDDGVLLDDGIDLDQLLFQHGTYAVDVGDEVWELNGLAASSWRLESNQRETIIQAGCVAHSLDRASAVNGDLSAITVPDFEWMDVHDLVVRMAAQSAVTPLGVSDEVQLDRFSIGTAQNLIRVQRQGSGLFFGEPRRVGHHVVTGSISNPRFSDDTYMADAIASTTLMMDAVWTGPEIAATGVNYELGVYLPHVHMQRARLDHRGPGLIPERYEMIASRPEGTVAGMPATVEATPIIVQVVSDESTNPFYA